MPQVNAANVAFLLTLDFDPDEPKPDLPDRGADAVALLHWIRSARLNGQRLSPADEQSLLSCSFVDITAARSLQAAALEHEVQMTGAHTELLDLLRPYMAGATTMAEALASCPPDVRARAEVLIQVAFPSGYIEVGR
jgi:hypothetical protein